MSKLIELVDSAVLQVSAHTGAPSDRNEVGRRQRLILRGGRNANLVEFPSLPRCTVTHVAARDAQGDVLYVAALKNRTDVQAGETLVFEPGDIRAEVSVS